MGARSFLVAVGLGLCVVVTTPGCSSSSSTGSGTLPGVGETKSVAITATTGGSVAVTGGSITIPPGALAADTTVTVAVKDKSAYGHADQVAVNVFDYGPNGTQFLKPVAMTIDLQGVAVPSGKTAMIAYYDGSNWQTLPDSAAAGGKVTASTTHFTPFTIVFVGGTQTGGGCGAFSACGGSLVGTWNFTAACATILPSTLGAPWTTCAQSQLSATVDFTGSVTFNADMSYSVNDTTSITINGSMPDSCLSSGQSCNQVGGSSGTATDSGGTCSVTYNQQPTTNTETGTYATSGNTFTTTKSGSTSGTAISYCVNGSTLTAQQIDSKGNTIQYTATKQ